jgi:glucan phosphoethanolaminetransferase (alkaline phosphatase superfamily)
MNEDEYEYLGKYEVYGKKIKNDDSSSDGGSGGDGSGFTILLIIGAIILIIYLIYRAVKWLIELIWALIKWIGVAFWFIIKYITWPVWFPFSKCMSLLMLMEKETSSTIFNLILIISSVLPILLCGIIAICYKYSNLNNRFLFWILYLLFFIWIFYASVYLVNIIFNFV